MKTISGRELKIISYQQRKRAHVQDQNRKRNIQNNQNE
jgi:hypothetical protein